MIRIANTIKWFLLVSVVSSCYGKRATQETKEQTGVIDNASIVELFTSEGCSSCPPADKLISKLESENKTVYVLSYHVDYWDRLGWKDPFSQSDFTERQRKYAEQFNLQSIYTPQVVINGAEEFVGSDAQRLHTALSQAKSLDTMNIQIERKDLTTLTLTYISKTTVPALMQIALVQPQATTEVKRGENKGRTLQHVNVVLQLTTINTVAASTPIEIKIPMELQATAFKAIIFLQAKKGNRITAASSVQLPAFADSKPNI